jgi:hypothetical protein
MLAERMRNFFRETVISLSGDSRHSLQATSGAAERPRSFKTDWGPLFSLLLVIRSRRKYGVFRRRHGHRALLVTPQYFIQSGRRGSVGTREIHF